MSSEIIPYVLKSTSGKILVEGMPRESCRGLVERAARAGALVGADLDDLLVQAAGPGGFPGDASLSGRLSLSQINLEGADLSGIRARNADMRCARLRSACMDGADLGGALLSGADMKGARMRGAGFEGAELRKADMSEDEGRIAGPRQGKAEAAVGKRHASAVGARFAGAAMDGLTATGADFSGADLSGASMRDAGLSDCKLDDARMDGLDLSRAVVTGCSIVSPSAHLAATGDAVMRNNGYVAWPSASDLLGSTWRMPAVVGRALRGEVAQFRAMPAEMRADCARSVATGAAMFAIATSGVAAYLVDHLAEGHQVPAAMEAVQGAVTQYAGMHHLGPLVAGGLVSAVLFKKGIEKVVEPLARGFAERMNLALPMFCRGNVQEGIGVLVTFGAASDRMREAVRAERENERIAVQRSGGVTVVMAPEGKLRDFLRQIGAVDAHDRLPLSGAVLVREVGRGWPEEGSPTRVTLKPDGSASADWEEDSGRIAWTAEWNPDGTLSTAVRSDPDDRAYSEFFDAAGLAALSTDAAARGLPAPPPVASADAALRGFRDEVVRAAVPYDGKVRAAQVTRDGSIVIRSIATGKIDNEPGFTAVRAANGETREFRDGAKVAPREPGMEDGLAPGMA